MFEIPEELSTRCLAYCQQNQLTLQALRGWGLDGFVWQTTQDSILKVARHEYGFQSELAVYLRFQDRKVERLHGFHVPILLHYDENLLVLELTYVRPPFVLDFAGATLDSPPPGFDPDSPGWIAEKRRIFGGHWPDVVRLLDALRLLDVYYTDVHGENIRTTP